MKVTGWFAVLRRLLAQTTIAAVIGGTLTIIGMLISGRMQNDARREEMAFDARQDRARQAIEIERDFLQFRSTAMLNALTALGKFATASENCMQTTEPLWTDAEYAPADKKAVEKEVEDFRADYNDASVAWNEAKSGYEPLFGNADPADHVHEAWVGVVASADVLQRCMDAALMDQPKEFDHHPCRAHAENVRRAVARLGMEVDRSRQRVIDRVRGR